VYSPRHELINYTKGTGKPTEGRTRVSILNLLSCVFSPTCNTIKLPYSPVQRGENESCIKDTTLCNLPDMNNTHVNIKPNTNYNEGRTTTHNYISSPVNHIRALLHVVHNGEKGPI